MRACSVNVSLRRYACEMNACRRECLTINVTRGSSMDVFKSNDAYVHECMQYACMFAV